MEILFLELLITLLLLHYYNTALGSSLSTSTVNLTSFHEDQSRSKATTKYFDNTGGRGYPYMLSVI